MPTENLLGGEEYYEWRAKECFKTAMKTFEAKRPVVSAMKLGFHALLMK